MLRFLLLQARLPTDPMKRHELECFVEQMRVDHVQIDVACLLDGPPTAAKVRDYDALLLGGSGDFYVSKRDLPNIDATFELLQEVAETGHPTFGSCFGYQLLVEALGGRIIHDPDRTEVGTYALELTDAGKEDPLFGTLPERFNAQMGHKDRAEIHPEGIDNLASSEMVPLQALRVHDQPIWAAQFHPELTCETNRDRFVHYLEGYAKHLSDEEREEALAGFDESPHGSDLLHRFLKLVFDD